MNLKLCWELIKVTWNFDGTWLGGNNFQDMGKTFTKPLADVMIVLNILNIRNIFFEELPAAGWWKSTSFWEWLWERIRGPADSDPESEKTVELLSGRRLGSQPIKNMGSEKQNRVLRIG